MKLRSSLFILLAGLIYITACTTAKPGQGQKISGSKSAKSSSGEEKRD